MNEFDNSHKKQIELVESESQNMKLTRVARIKKRGGVVSYRNNQGNQILSQSNSNLQMSEDKHDIIISQRSQNVNKEVREDINEQDEERNNDRKQRKIRF